MKKRVAWFVAFVAGFGICASVAFAQKVTLKSSPKTPPSAEKVSEEEKETAADASANASDAASSSDSSNSKTEPSVASASEQVVEPAIQTETAKVGSDSEILTPIPTSPLVPPTDKERDAKYPIVPAALRMTLECLVPTKELRNVRVLKATSRIPRAAFVPKDFRDYAYEDAALPIGESQTISPPFVVAYMTEALDPQPTDRVLEIGTGSGYQAAVLSCLVSEVYTIEIVKKLGRRAAETLKKLEYSNVFVKLGDGYQGWPEAAPFDKIIVTCSPENIPQPLIDQLKEGGKMLIPIGERYEQYFVLCEKKDGKLEKQTLTPACFVPMTGEAESKREIQPNPEDPRLVGGGFEEANPTALSVAPTATWKNDGKTSVVQKNNDVQNGSNAASASANSKIIDELAIELPPRRPTPRGWYSTRNVYLEERADAPEGRFVCVCDNAAVVDEHRKKDANEARFAAATLPEFRKTSTENWDAVVARQREQEAVCSMRQNFAVDGSRAKKLSLTGKIRTTNLTASQGRKTVSVIKINFFDDDREPVGGETLVLAVGTGSSDWRDFKKEFSVPRRAAEASLQAGILDGVGTIEFDMFELKNFNLKKIVFYN